VKVFVRTDASSRIGTGHLMRCLALAQALQQRGAGVSFVMREVPAALTATIEGLGFKLFRLPEGFPREEGRLGVPWDTDALQTAAVLKGQGNADWLVIDHYGIDCRWQERVRTTSCKILVIDDLAQSKHSCDVLLNQNLMTDAQVRYRSLVPGTCRLLTGPRFALLREEFHARRASLRRDFDRVRNLLVFLGGADPDGVSLRVLNVLDAMRPRELRVTVALGAASPHRTTVEKAYAERAGFQVIVQSSNMAQLMATADLAVGAGGVSTWERCCLGLPSIVMAIAENQLEVSKAAAGAGACLFLGSSAVIPDDELAASLKLMIGNAGLRRSQSEIGSRLVDGRGCQRAAKAVLQTALQVRPARAEDAERVFAWRNDERTRRHSHDPRPFAFEAHLQWFRECLVDSRRVLLIGEAEQRPVGVLRYDIERNIATASIYLDPALHGQGYGPSLLLSGDRWLKQARPEIARVRAEMGLENHGSRSAFAEAGYRAHGLIFEKPLGL
jgi:UDP-2,4-diacetamido-2,4,6-trideoxy-beta-L-altropyranose hydrolase